MVAMLARTPWPYGNKRCAARVRVRVRHVPHGDADPASGTRLSFAAAGREGGGGAWWGASKRCDGVLVWRIGLEKVLAGTRVVVFATR